MSATRTVLQIPDGVDIWALPPPGGIEFAAQEVEIPIERPDSQPGTRRAERSLEEPEWERFGFRGEVGRLLWGRGLKRKAIRFLSCNKCARPGLCSRYPDEHKYFVPNGCEVVFCKQCADESRRGLLNAYLHVVFNAVLE